MFLWKQFGTRSKLFTNACECQEHSTVKNSYIAKLSNKGIPLSTDKSCNTLATNNEILLDTLVNYERKTRMNILYIRSTFR